ncbi:MAG TPA: hypothetical protein VF142_21730 [Longimicrobium sp.]
MKKNPLELSSLDVQTFETTSDLSAALGRDQRGTACWELCANDPTSNPDHDSCGAEICNG